MSTLEVNAIKSRTGTDITIESGASITGTASQFKITGGTAGQAIITDGSGGLSFAASGGLPTQSGQSGKFLTTDGTDASWSTITHPTELPTQTSQSGKYLTTDGTVVSWATVDALPTQTSQSGKFLTTDGTTATWEAVDALPSQTGQAGEYLKTDGTTATWEPVTGGAAYDADTSSTGYFDLPAGTDAQRPGSPATGMLRFNSDAISLEHYADGTWIQFAGSAPTVSSVSPITVLTENTTVTITGANFQAGATVKLIGLDSTQLNPNSVAFINSGELSITTPVLTVANEPYDIKVTNPNGGSSTLVNCIDAGGIPAWTSPAAGSLGTWYEDIAITPVTMVATDPDAQTVTFSVTSGAFPTGVTMDTATGVVSGTPSVGDTYNASGVTHNFTVGASDSVNTTNRAFNILRKWEDGTAGGPFASLVSAASFITGQGQSAGNYYFATKNSTTTQFKVVIDNGVWISIPIGTTNDGTNTGALMTSSDFYTKEVYGDQTSAGNIGWNGSNQWDTTGSTNASGNNVAAYVAVIDFGLPYRYVTVLSAVVNGTGAQTADWQNRQDSVLANTHDPGDYGDGPWMAFQRPTDFIMQANWGNVGNSSTSTNFSSFGTPLDLGAPGAGTEFCLGVCGGYGEHYSFISGTIYLKA